MRRINSEYDKATSEINQANADMDKLYDLPASDAKTAAIATKNAEMTSIGNRRNAIAQASDTLTMDEAIDNPDSIFHYAFGAGR